MSRPGTRLRVWGSRLVSADAMRRVVDPAIADLQVEYASARERGRIWTSRWIRLSASIAVLRVLVRMLWIETWWTVGNLSDAERRIRNQLIGWSFAALASTTYLFALQPLLGLRRHLPADRPWIFLTLLPQALAITIPIAVVLGLAMAIGRDKLSKNLAATILSFALLGSAVSFVNLAWIVPAANQAFRVEMAKEFGMPPGQRLAKGANERTLGELRAALNTPLYGDFHGDRRHRTRKALTYYLRFALPFAPIALTLAMVASRFGRASTRGRRVMAALGACAVYYTLMVVGETGALAGWLPAVVGSWLPNLVFLTLAVATPSLRRRTNAA